MLPRHQAPRRRRCDTSDGYAGLKRDSGCLRTCLVATGGGRSRQSARPAPDGAVTSMSAPSHHTSCDYRFPMSPPTNSSQSARSREHAAHARSIAENETNLEAATAVRDKGSDADRPDLPEKLTHGPQLAVHFSGYSGYSVPGCWRQNTACPAGRVA